MVKIKFAFVESPVFCTEAVEPGAPVTVLPIVTVNPAGPVAPMDATSCQFDPLSVAGSTPVLGWTATYDDPFLDATS
jgi:hypothetical protein